jgi:hypothetical protein
MSSPTPTPPPAPAPVDLTPVVQAIEDLTIAINVNTRTIAAAAAIYEYWQLMSNVAVEQATERKFLIRSVEDEMTARSPLGRVIDGKFEGVDEVLSQLGIAQLNINRTP